MNGTGLALTDIPVEIDMRSGSSKQSVNSRVLKRSFMAIAGVVTLLLNSGCSVLGMSSVEEASYRVLESEDKFELTAMPAASRLPLDNPHVENAHRPCLPCLISDRWQSYMHQPCVPIRPPPVRHH